MTRPALRLLIALLAVDAFTFGQTPGPIRYLMSTYAGNSQFALTPNFLNGAFGMADAPNGHIYVATGGCVYDVAPDKSVAPYAGCGGTGESVDGGPATQGRLSIGGIAVDHSGTLYITEPNYNRISKVGVDGFVHTFAGNGADGCGNTGSATNCRLTSNQWHAIFPDWQIRRGRAIRGDNRWRATVQRL